MYLSKNQKKLLSIIKDSNLKITLNKKIKEMNEKEIALAIRSILGNSND